MAAGLGFKTFTTGEVLTAGDTNGYLMQGILVFATEAARNAAITVPAEGQFAFTKDNNSTWYYDGAAWVASGASGDVTGITVSNGIAGTSLTGPVPALTLATTAKGDLLAGTGSNTAQALTVGANNTVLTADSTTATGLKWAAAVAGKVLQVVQGSTTTAVSNSTTTLADTTLTATITPSLASSKILVMVTQNGLRRNGGSNLNSLRLILLRGSTTLQTFGYYLGWVNTDIVNLPGSAVTYRLDSPATTAATTYKTQFANENATASVVVQESSITTSTIILMEIGA